ncbi:glycosyl transferase [Aquabacterium sp. NJ1]|uniref:DUF1972 domain-containing protein n=1 Tax=Aquabacterium sp. NJ1 TaxID=1538295 RepID=UPI00052B693F|nr:DUF1972 domain-containing protein [Aquabacterium sp. NJ1]KGM40996.1 glycosyl transferase [Aquabacterium sp. NJ1]
MKSIKPTLRILGIRGIPANHGGFETFAEQLSLYLRDRGWRVVVYCQEDGEGAMFEDEWQGIERVRIPVPQAGALGTVVFDWKSIAHACKFKDLCLTLGYNTAAFCARMKLHGIPNVINMDGIEWSRAKWGKLAKTWFWMNDWAGCWLGDQLVADHPEIKMHLSSRAPADKITTIAYGAPEVLQAPEEPLKALSLQPGKYATVIARPEPENSILEIVKGFSKRQRGIKLAVLGKYEPKNRYHNEIQAAAGGEVSFLGAIYDKAVLRSLRFHSAFYVHGHQVGGTNPSLVEAMGAGNAVVAHDNKFNRWVVGEGARFFRSSDDLDQVLTKLLSSDGDLERMRAASRARFESDFTWEQILGQYELLLTRFLPKPHVMLKAVGRTTH